MQFIQIQLTTFQLTLVLAVDAWVSSLAGVQWTRFDSARTAAVCLHLLASLTPFIPVSCIALGIVYTDRDLSSSEEDLFAGWLALCLLHYAWPGRSSAVLTPVAFY